MEKFAFVSRHVPTESQISLASAKGIELIHVGDRDGFKVNPKDFESFKGVIVVHAQMALTLFTAGLHVGVFNNVNRAPLGEKPQFETTDLVVTRAS